MSLTAAQITADVKEIGATIASAVAVAADVAAFDFTKLTTDGEALLQEAAAEAGPVIADFKAALAEFSTLGGKVSLLLAGIGAKLQAAGLASDGPKVPSSLDDADTNAR